MTSLQTSQQDGPEESARDGRAIAMSGDLSGTVSGSADGGLNRSARHSSARSLSRADFNSKGANLVNRDKGCSVRRWFQALLVALLAVGLTVTGLVAGTQEARADGIAGTIGKPTTRTNDLSYAIPFTFTESMKVKSIILKIDGESESFYNGFSTDSKITDAFSINGKDLTSSVAISGTKGSGTASITIDMGSAGMDFAVGDEIVVRWRGFNAPSINSISVSGQAIPSNPGTPDPDPTNTESPDPGTSPDNPSGDDVTVKVKPVIEDATDEFFSVPMVLSEDETVTRVVMTITGDAAFYNDFDPDADVRKFLVEDENGNERVVSATFTAEKRANSTVEITADFGSGVFVSADGAMTLEWGGDGPTIGRIGVTISTSDGSSGSGTNDPPATGDVIKTEGIGRSATYPENGTFQLVPDPDNPGLVSEVVFTAKQTSDEPLKEVHLHAENGYFTENTERIAELAIGGKVISPDLYDLRFDNNDVYYTFHEPYDVQENTVVTANASWTDPATGDHGTATIWLFHSDAGNPDDGGGTGSGPGSSYCTTGNIWASVQTKAVGEWNNPAYFYAVEFNRKGEELRSFPLTRQPGNVLGETFPYIAGSDIAISPDGKYMVSLDADNYLAVYDLTDGHFGELMGSIKINGVDSFVRFDILNSLAFSADRGLYFGGEAGDSNGDAYNKRRQVYKITAEAWASAMNSLSPTRTISVNSTVLISASQLDGLSVGGFSGDFVTLDDGSVITALHTARGGKDDSESTILKFDSDGTRPRIVGNIQYQGQTLKGVYGLAKSDGYIFFATADDKWYWIAEDAWDWEGDANTNVELYVENDNSVSGMHNPMGDVHDVGDVVQPSDDPISAGNNFPRFNGATGIEDSGDCSVVNPELDFEKNAIDLSGNNTIDEPDGTTTVSNPVADDNETYRKVAYDLVVTNSDAADGKYTLVDNPYLTEDVLPSYVRISQKDSAGKGGAISKEGNVTLQTKWLPLDDVYNPNVNGFASDETGTLEISREINKLKDSSSTSAEVLIDKGATHVYQVEFLYQMNPEAKDTSTDTWDDLTCQGSKETVYTRRKGLQNEATLTNVSSGGTITKDDCVPIEQPKSFLEIKKVGADNNETPLDAEFALFQVNEKGKQVGKVISVGNAKEAKFSIPSDGYYAIQETVAPAGGYALLPGPVYLQVKTKSESDPNTGTSTNVQRLYLRYLDTQDDDDDESNDQLKPITEDNKGTQLPLIDLLGADGKLVEAEDIDAGITKNADFVFQVQVADVTTGDLPESGGMGVFVPASIAVLLAAAAGAATRRRPLGVNGDRKARPKPRH